MNEQNQQEQQKQPHKDGPPWDSERVFSSFSEADVYRKNRQTDDTKQVKVKRYINSVGVETFVVKCRTKPELNQLEEKLEKKKKKK